MSWHNESSEETQTKWPTWNSRLSWARNNYQKKPEYDARWLTHKFLVMLANLTALNDLIEEKANERLLTPKQVKEWRGLYEQWRPTQPVGRPKNGSVRGPTE